MNVHRGDNWPADILRRDVVQRPGNISATLAVKLDISTAAAFAEMFPLNDNVVLLSVVHVYENSTLKQNKQQARNCNTCPSPHARLPHW